MDQELDAIRNKKRYANNTLAGATWEQSLSTEMNAVTSRYNIENITLRNKIHQLDEQLKQLN